MDFEEKKTMAKKIIDTVIEQAHCTQHLQDGVGEAPDLDFNDYEQVEKDIILIIQDIVRTNC